MAPPPHEGWRFAVASGATVRPGFRVVVAVASRPFAFGLSLLLVTSLFSMHSRRSCVKLRRIDAIFYKKFRRTT